MSFELMRDVGTKNDVVVEENQIFFVNHLFPIGLKPPVGKDSPFYTLIFWAHQDLMDRDLWLMIFLNRNPLTYDGPVMSYDPIETIWIENAPFLESKRIQDKKIAKEYCTGMDLENLFIFDMRFQPVNRQMYFEGAGYRTIALHKLQKQPLKFQRECFLQLQMFISDFVNSKKWTDEYFVNPVYERIPCTKIEQVKLDASSIIRKAEYTKLGFAMVSSHYTVNCGPTQYQFNYIVPVSLKKLQYQILREPLDYKIYFKEYQKDIVINQMSEVNKKVYDESTGDIYLILEMQKEPMQILNLLKFEKELVEQTNLLEDENAIFSIIKK